MKVEFSWPLIEGWYETQTKIEAAIRPHGGRAAGDSGAGLGMRDMTFIFPSRDKADAGIKAVKALEIEGLEIGMDDPV